MIKNKLFLAFMVSLLLLILAGGNGFAANNTLCKPDQNVFEKVSNAFKSLDIRRTAQNLLITLLTDGPIQIIAGRNPTEMVQCSYKTLKNNPNPGLQGKATAATGQCSTIDADTQNTDCTDFSSTYDYQVMRGDSRLSYIDTRATGSLLGIANTLDGGIRTEPVPVNLAYFWNDSIKNVPFAGTALAADVSYGNLPSTLMVPLLGIWKVFRNIAFGMLSIVMLVVGVMIMTRRKLSPQAVVTAQYALPRIALAVVLIVFSYPIGAVLGSSMQYLARLIESILYASLGMSSSGVASVLLSILFLDLLSSGLLLGIPGLIAVAILSLVILVLYIIILVRAWLLVLKLIFSIVFAPIQFALGAIPGNESTMQNWFKKAISYVAGYVALFAVVSIVNLLILTTAGQFGASLTGTGASILIVIFTPVFLIFGYIQALKTPKKIESLIMGEQKPQRRK